MRGVPGAIYWVLDKTGLKVPAWNAFEYILTNHRSVLVTVVVLPMSFVFDLFWRLRSWYVSDLNVLSHWCFKRRRVVSAHLMAVALSRYITKVKSAPELHDQRVQEVLMQVCAPFTVFCSVAVSDFSSFEQKTSIDLRYTLLKNLVCLVAVSRRALSPLRLQVLEWKAGGKQSHMCTARPGWMTVSPRHNKYKSRLHRVAIDLHDILGLDEGRMVLRVEPSVNILQACLPPSAPSLRTAA